LKSALSLSKNSSTKTLVEPAMYISSTYIATMVT